MTLTCIQWLVTNFYCEGKPFFWKVFHIQLCLAYQYSLDVKLTSMNTNKGALFQLALQTTSQSCSFKWNLSLSVSHHKSTFRAPAVKKSGSSGRQERAALDTEQPGMFPILSRTVTKTIWHKIQIMSHYLFSKKKTILSWSHKQERHPIPGNPGTCWPSEDSLKHDANLYTMIGHKFVLWRKNFLLKSIPHPVMFSLSVLFGG